MTDSSEDRWIEVAMAADEKFADGLFVTAASVAMSANSDIGLAFTFLDGGFSDAFFDFLSKRLKLLHSHVRIRRFKVDESMFSGFPDWRGNKMAYARFLLPDLLPDIRHIIYCDVDFVWLRDVAGLWDQRDDAVVLQAVRDPGVLRSPEPQWYARHGYGFCAERYFCTGLLMMNLGAFRRERLVESVYKKIRENPDILFPDQTSLNLLLDGRVRFLDSNWMRFSLQVTQQDLVVPIVLHYVGDVPWRENGFWYGVTDTTLIWYLIDARARGVSFIVNLCKFKCAGVYLRDLVLLALTHVMVVKQALYFSLRLLGKRRLVDFLQTRACNISPVAVQFLCRE